MSVETQSPAAPHLIDPASTDFKTRSPIAFDPSKHLQFSPPSDRYLLDDLLLSPENATSKVAITKPFPLFTLGGVEELRRDLFRPEVINKYAWTQKPGTYIIRGSGKNTPFVYDAWRSEAVRKACSEAAGLELEIVFDYEIAHVNVQLDSTSAHVDELDEFAKVLPSAYPPRTEALVGHNETTRDEDLRSNDSQGLVGRWHNDCYPWVCVCMISDPTGMEGGETALRKGDGSLLKVSHRTLLPIITLLNCFG
jgi:hypothetical protein